MGYETCQETPPEFFGIDQLYPSGTLTECTLDTSVGHDFVQPKYIFSKESESQTTSTYDIAIRGLERQDTLFLVEGQGDVWKLWECGVKNAVGLFGKDIIGTEEITTTKRSYKTCCSN